MTMKMIVAVPFTLMTLGVLGCSQQASTAPAVQHPAQAQSETNMFGENKEAAAGSAADARAAAYAAEQAPRADSAGSTGAGAQSAPPK
jgi:hypothetical protein